MKGPKETLRPFLVAHPKSNLWCSTSVPQANVQKGFRSVFGEMTTRDFETLMNRALQAYRNGYPVVIFSSTREPLHGHEFLEAIVDLSMPLQAFFVDGVAIELGTPVDMRKRSRARASVSWKARIRRSARE